MADIATVEKDVVTITTQDVKEYIAPNATDKEVYMFLNICKSYGLNPFKREVHFVKYGNTPGQTIVGYETYLKRAEATGKLDGWRAWVEGTKAKCIIYRKDWKYPFEWEIDIEEFDKKQALWLKMKNFLAKKVVICQAMRLCFSEEMGGMPYIPEEIGVDHNGKETPVEPPTMPSEAPKTPQEATLRQEIRDMVLDLCNKDLNAAADYLNTVSGYKKTTLIPADKLKDVHKKVSSDYKMAFQEVKAEEL